MQLPFDKFWSALVNYILLMHQEVSEKDLVELCWYTSQCCESFEYSQSDDSLREQKLAKRAKVMFLINHLSEVASEI